MTVLPIKISGKQIDLISLNKNHFNDFYDYARDPIFYEFLEYEAPGSKLQTQKLFEKFLKRNDRIKSYYYAINERKFTKCIGIIGIFNFKKNNTECEVSYGLSRDYQGKGIAHESMMMVCNYLFNENIDIIKAVTPSNNTPSIKFLEGLLFKKKKVFTNKFNYNGISVDGCEFHLSKEDLFE